MKTINFARLYNFSELAPEIQKEIAIEANPIIFEYYGGYDNENSLKMFCTKFGINLKS